MADEARLNLSIRIRKDNINYSPIPTTFSADISTGKGPTPGVITVSENGTDIDLSQLGDPGLCRFCNQSLLHSIIIGRFDYMSNRFYPFMKLLPGEFYIVRLHEQVGEEFTGTGTGTTAALTSLRAKVTGYTRAHTDETANLLVEAFET